MSELALFLVRTGFLALIWIFIFSIISVIRADLFGQKVVSKVASANLPNTFVAGAVSNPASPKPAEQKATKLVVTAGEKVGTAPKNTESPVQQQYIIYISIMIYFNNDIVQRNIIKKSYPNK